MAAHRYWRVQFNAPNSGSFVGLNELYMTDGTYTNRFSATYGTITGSSFYAPESLVVANSADGNQASAWTSSGAAMPQWLKIDFGSTSANWHEIFKIGIQARVRFSEGQTFPSDQAPRDFKLQYSDDDSSWTDVITVTGSTGWGTLGELRWFDPSGLMTQPPPPSDAYGTSGRFWRIRPTSVDGGTVVGMREIELRATSGGADQTTSGSGLARAFRTAEGSPGSLIDNNSLSYWASGDPKQVWGYLFASSITINEIVITARTSFQNQTPKDFVLEWWDNGVWVEHGVVTGSTGWASGETRTFTFAAAAAARPVVFVCT